jgi:hypothetical protein
MKNFPHQINDLTKLVGALTITRQLAEEGIPLTDENFGERLTRRGIYTYRDITLTIDEFLANELLKPPANRGSLTVSRDLRRFFELMGFITVFADKTVRINPAASQLLQAPDVEAQKDLWKNALLQLGLEGVDGEVSHPYRILLKLVNSFPGIETPKLMLALEVENDSDEEFGRISDLVPRSVLEIREITGVSRSMAANAVKILPGIAEQLGDIERINNRAYSSGDLVVTEDEITTEQPERIRARVPDFRATNSQNIARDPILNIVSSVSIDYTEAIRLRQRRLTEHQEIVRLLGLINEQAGYRLFEGKFDCLAIRDGITLLYEVKTILESLSDQEKQTVKGVGQLKYYKYSIVHTQMGLGNIKEVIVFSRMPHQGIIDFCSAEDISVLWRDGDHFEIYNTLTNSNERFEPDLLLGE